MGLKGWNQQLRQLLRYAPYHINLLAIDLDGDGAISIENTVYFDVDNDNFIEKITWFSKDDGVLAHDLNRNGRIDGIAELFASDMVPVPTKLRLLDSNNDGVIDAKDRGFNKLSIWQDDNSNGCSEHGELQSLKKMEIHSIALDKLGNTGYRFLISQHQVDVMDSYYRPKNKVIERSFLQDDVDMFEVITFDKASISETEIESYLEVVDSRLSKELRLISSSLNKAAARLPTCQEQAVNKVTLDNARHIETFNAASKQLERKFNDNLIQIEGVIYQLAKDQGWNQTRYNQSIEQAILNLQKDYKLEVEFLVTNYSKVIEEDSAEAKHNAINLCIQQQKAVMATVRLQEQEQKAGAANYISHLKLALEKKPYLDSGIAAVKTHGKLPGFMLSLEQDNIYRWAGLDNIPQGVKNSGVCVVVEARKIVFMEHFIGHPFKEWGIAKSTGEEIAMAIDNAWNIIIAEVMKNHSPEHLFNDTSFYSRSQVPVNLTLPAHLSHIVGSIHGDTLVGNNMANYINGEGGDDEIHGAADNDTLYGAGGNNSLFGDDGDDLFLAFEGYDFINGGSGNDTVSYHHLFAKAGVHVDLMKGVGRLGHARGDRYSGVENIRGSRFDDLLLGDNNSNTIYGMEGDDEIYGLDGDDKIIPGPGSNTCHGGDGLDYISYEAASASVTINMMTGVAKLSSFEHDKFTGIENAIGTNHNDEIKGDAGDNKIFALDGDDTVIGNGGDDVISGGSGRNKLVGADGNDRFIIGEGANTVTGGAGYNMVDYNNAKVAVTVNLRQQSGEKDGGDADVFQDIKGVFGSPYNDTIIGHDNNHPLYYGEDGDDYIEGDSWNDQIHGGAGYNTLIGNGGNDIFFIAEGVNIVNGGEGYDTINYSKYHAREYHGITDKEYQMRRRNDLLPAHSDEQFSMPDGINKSGFSVDLSLSVSDKLDSFFSVENVVGSHYNDLIIGDEGSNVLLGVDGNDTIYGRDGDDRIESGRGISILHGQGGDDEFTITMGMAHLYGGDGYDLLDLLRYPHPVTINIKDGYISYGKAEHYDFQDIEAVRGTAKMDLIYDDGNDNEIYAGGGDDEIHLTDGYDMADGGDGDDVIYLNGTGRKLIWGGSGHDRFVITPLFLSQGKDDVTIVDFKGDVIDLGMLPYIHTMEDIQVDRYEVAKDSHTTITIYANQVITLFDTVNLSQDNFIFYLD